MKTQLQGVGLGLRRPFIPALKERGLNGIDFLEVAPENWMRIGGSRAEEFHYFSQQVPIICHGLSLNLGGQKPLNEIFLKQLKIFFNEKSIPVYSEHLSYCADEGNLYDLLPIPFTQEAVFHVAKRIRHCQDILERRIAVENVSYYAAPGQELTEIEFINAVLAEADCNLLLDVNNTYVNSINHDYDAKVFLKALPVHRIVYLHMAGHLQQEENLLIDTHGEAIIDPVWDLLDFAYKQLSVFPTLLERDFNLPPLNELLIEIKKIKAMQCSETKETQYG